MFVMNDRVVVSLKRKGKGSDEYSIHFSWSSCCPNSVIIFAAYFLWSDLFFISGSSLNRNL